jgi:hypothetical protein
VKVTARPVRRAGVTLRRLEDGSAEVLAADGQALGVVNVTAAAAFELSDGATSVAEMAEAASAVFAVDPDRAADDLLSALGALHAIGALDEGSHHD